MKLKYSIIFILITFGCFAFAQDTTFSEKYFKLINTYNSIDEVYRAHPELKPKPPHIVINDDEVVFYDDNGAVINTMPVKQEEDIPKTDTLYEKYRDKYNIYRDYRTVDGELLVIYKSYRNEPSPYPFRSLTEVYDKTGKLIVNNLLEDTGVKISPDRKYFATSYEGEAGVGLVEIFDITGKMVCLFHNETEVGIRYDRKNNLIINGYYDFQITVKDENCNDLIVVNTYTDLHIGDISSFFYDKGSASFLISVSETGLYYFNKYDDTPVWKKDIDGVVEQCLFNLSKNIIIVQTRTNFIVNNPKYEHIIILDSDSGKVIRDLSIDKLLLFDDKQIIIEKGGGYYEYKI